MLLRKAGSAAKILRERGISGLLKAIKEDVLRLSDFRNRRNRAKLTRILKKFDKDPGEIIIYFPGVDWNLPLFQRPQQFAIHLAKTGRIVFYCTYNATYDNFHGFVDCGEGLYLTDRPETLLSELRGCWIMVSSIANMSIETIREFKWLGFRILYDYMDEINPEICGDGAEDLIKRHKALGPESADLVTVISTKLYNEMTERFPPEMVEIVPNGVDYQHFHIERKMGNCPEDIRPVVLKQRPIIGYHGALAKWIDYGLLNFVAAERPEWNIVLIGWDYDNSMQQLVSRENIIYLGLKNYKELPYYSIWFDAAIIPFIEGEIARATSPIKLYEYMAMNKPVVVTKDLVECQGYRNVLTALNRADFIAKIEKALLLKDDPEFVRATDEEARKCTWQEMVLKIDRKLRII